MTKQAKTTTVLPITLCKATASSVVNYIKGADTMTGKFADMVTEVVKRVPASVKKDKVTGWIREQVKLSLTAGFEARGDTDFLAKQFNMDYTASGKVKASSGRIGFYINGQGEMIVASSLATMCSNAGGRFLDCNRDFDEWMNMDKARFHNAPKKDKAKPKSPNAKGTIAALDKGRKLYAKLYQQKITKAQAEELVRAIAAIVS